LEAPGYNRKSYRLRTKKKNVVKPYNLRATKKNKNQENNQSLRTINELQLTLD